MKILFLNYEYPPLGGGAANATKHLLDCYAQKRNISVDLVTSAVDKTRKEALSERINIYRVDIGKKKKSLTHQSASDLLRYALAGYKQAVQLLKKNDYDYIHAFFGVPCGAMAWRLSHRFGVPYIVSLRGADVPGFSDRYEKIYPFLTPLIKTVWRNSAAVVANSEHLRSLAHRTDPKLDIRIIYNGVDTDFFSPAYDSSEESDGENKSFVILVASRLMRRKGIRYLIDAFARLRDKYPDRKIKLVIAGGDGDAAEALRLQVKNLHLGEAVEFTGHLDRDKLLIAYREADVFVLPSLNEGMSNNMLEALACGLPVVVTRTGGSEIINDTVNGFLVDRESSESIVTALEKLLNAQKLRKSMGKQARLTAEKLSWQAAADSYEKLYYELYSSTH